MSRSKVILIVGASSGIGLECAKHLAERGHQVVAGHLEASEPHRQGEIQVSPLDVRSEESIQRAVEHTMSLHGRIDAVFNCAGFAMRGAIEETSIDEGAALFDVNFFGTARVVRAVMPIMRAQRSGKIINMSSGVAQVALPFAGYYSASKYALEGYSEALRMEVSAHGIAVSVLVGSWTKTNIAHNMKVAREPIEAYEDARTTVEKRVQKFIDSAPGALAVARRVEKILRARRPRFRYRIGADATSSFFFKWLLPERTYEKMVASYYKLDL